MKIFEMLDLTLGMKNKNLLPTLTFAFILIGIGLTVYLFQHHYQLAYGLLAEKSICNVGGAFDCDAVNTSTFSEVLGIPVSIIGTFTYIVLGLLLIGFKLLDKSEGERPGRFLFYLTSFMMAGNVYFFFVSTFVIKAFCLFCVLHYVATFIVWILVYLQVPGPRWAHFFEDVKALLQGGEAGARGTLFVLAIIPIGSIIGNGMYVSSLAPGFDRMVKRSIAEWQISKKVDFDIPNAPTLGNPNAPVEIVEFFDFRCGHCKKAFLPLHAFVSANKDKVKWVIQNFPLSSGCNPHIKGGPGGNSLTCSLAKAGWCAHLEGKFIEAQEWIFDRQLSLTEQSIDDLIKHFGFNDENFKACINSEETAAEIARQAERGHAAGLKGTPAIYFNGKALPLGFMIPVLKEAMAHSGH